MNEPVQLANWCGKSGISAGSHSFQRSFAGTRSNVVERTHGVSKSFGKVANPVAVLACNAANQSIKKLLWG